ncbi:MAG: DUF805 domain-containing protein [Acidobacteria bacterium]|nr:DUF805 domain-containing protein [Acidobacteriota bacterium]MBV9477926.1 DUF805 domain-containing protein [Acidobacteriota bacterium]
MTFQDAIRVCLTKYADFSGTASRAEYWWFVLFLLLAGCAASVLGPSYCSIFLIGMLLPLLAAGTRRLRETGRSGWWQLMGLVPFAGLIILAVLLAEAPRPFPALEQATPDQPAASV